jgi:hypothetical protein
MMAKLGAILVVVSLLYGCAGATDAATELPVAEPDCSFRAATSCWTLSARLPPKRAEPADSAARELMAPPPQLFANADDSTTSTSDRELR